MLIAAQLFNLCRGVLVLVTLGFLGSWFGRAIIRIWNVLI